MDEKNSFLKKYNHNTSNDSGSKGSRVGALSGTQVWKQPGGSWIGLTTCLLL